MLTADVVIVGAGVIGSAIAYVPALEQVFLATGHYRNGILLAPITGKIVAEMITGAAPSVPMAPLSYRRH